MSHDESIFSTRDLTMAATFITLKFPLIGIDFQVEGTKQNPVGYFKFDETQHLKEARQKFTQGLLSVEPRAFMLNIHSLKAEVTNMWKSPHSRTF